MNGLKATLVSILLAASSAYAQELSFTMGKDETEALILRKRVIQNKAVSTVSYKSPRHGTFTRAVPQSMFNSMYSEGRKWQIRMKNDRDPAAIFCNDAIQITMQKQNKKACLDSLTRQERTNFFSWFNQQSKLALPIKL